MDAEWSDDEKAPIETASNQKGIDLLDFLIFGAFCDLIDLKIFEKFDDLEKFEDFWQISEIFGENVVNFGKC